MFPIFVPSGTLEEPAYAANDPRTPMVPDSNTTLRCRSNLKPQYPRNTPLRRIPELRVVNERDFRTPDFFIAATLIVNFTDTIRSELQL